MLKVEIPYEEQSLIEQLRTRARIRRSISSRKSVQNNEPDRLSELLERAAARIEELEYKVKCLEIRLEE